MSFCDHCQGQRFDRAQVLRALRDARKRVRAAAPGCEAALTLAIETIRNLEIPHLEEEVFEGEVIH